MGQSQTVLIIFMVSDERPILSFISVIILQQKNYFSTCYGQPKMSINVTTYNLKPATNTTVISP